MKILANLDLSKNQLLNAVFQILPSAPANPVEGLHYYNSTSKAFMYYNGSTWIDVTKTYVHPTSDGNKHVPANGTTNDGKYLKATAVAGQYAWSAIDASEIAESSTKRFVSDSQIANWTDAANKGHIQNTDTGTTSQTFQVGTSGTKIKNNSGTELQIRNAGDTDFADLRVKNLIVEGSTTTINSNEVNIGDNQIVLNSDITSSAQNTGGGISIKRLDPKGGRKDAEIVFNDSTGKWVTVGGDIGRTLLTAQIANKIVAPVNASLETVVTHNLNTRDLTVTVRETSESYAVVYPDIEYTSEDKLTVRFAVAPTAGQYTITIVG